ncbi:uncharacterized protein ATNIH1004_003992 [Aspergillus tanneri]|uniref:MADS-box domain-containing protein n=1 Tax=Aspergillus tanneri TaxID=1220188 RepID=A0A5M9MU24_9EURO|nr:uncharacterized protein ATNIH1004_003992 [Aspergillus tanneri]KAA8648109.1 hypothetical protein ATNIH1004_003992 [Aspergillus tanneri]
MSDKFIGFSDAAVSCLASLNGGVIATDVDWQRFKYGCLCGQCISGFLGPWMRFALECQAEMWSDLLLEDINDGKFWIRSNCTFLTFLPREVRNKLKTNQYMRKEFMKLCDHIAACLQRNMIPNEQNVKMVLRDARERSSSRNFLQRGGSVGAVATMLFQRAVESDELSGDPLHMEAFEAKIQRLPECQNDHEFGFTKEVCASETLKHSRTSRKSVRQKRDRRRTSLIKKSSEYSRMCGADVCLGIRIRETGRVYIFSADASGFWAFVGSQLDSYYPTPSQITDMDVINSRDPDLLADKQTKETEGLESD